MKPSPLPTSPFRGGGSIQAPPDSLSRSTMAEQGGEGRGGAKRPIILTVICIIGILWSLMNFIFVFSPFIKKISNWAPAIYGVIVAAQFISFIGAWHMKRWGVLLFISAFTCKMIFSLAVDDISYVGIGLALTLIIFFLVFYRRMAEEL